MVDPYILYKCKHRINPMVVRQTLMGKTSQKQLMDIDALVKQKQQEASLVTQGWNRIKKYCAFK